MNFTVEFYKRGENNSVRDFILSLDEELQFSLGSLSKKMEGTRNLFEIRVKGRNRAVRVFYCFRKGRIIILLHGFVKKTEKAPRKELDIAKQRLKEVENE